jgi:hypothetical protein
MRDEAATGRMLAVDRGYSVTHLASIKSQVAAQQVELVYDLKADQRRRYVLADGVLALDGGLFTTGTPAGLYDLPRPPMYEAAFDNRAAFAARPNGTTKGGSLRFRHCACPTRVIKNEHGVVTAVSGMTARCVNSPYFNLMPRTLPQTTCVKGADSNCSGGFTVAPADLPALHQKHLWGTSAWAEAYHRRNSAEAANAHEEYHQGVDRHTIRVRDAKWALYNALLTAGFQLRIIRQLMIRLGAQAPDAFHPQTMAACLARVGITPGGPTALPVADGADPPPLT